MFRKTGLEARRQALAELEFPTTDAQKLEAIRLYIAACARLVMPERQIPETVQPAEPTLKMAQQPLTKLERKRLKRDQRKQRSAAKAS